MNGTLNVTPIESKQPQPACHFSINAIIDGFPVTIEGDGKAGDLKTIVEKLKAIGAQPPSGNRTNSPNSTDDAPICEFHGKMRKGNHGFFCPRKMGDGSYCKSKG
jgi:hypothetical protein